MQSREVILPLGGRELGRKLSRRHHRSLCRRCAGLLRLGDRDLRRARGYGVLQNVSLGDREVDDRRGEFEILRATCQTFLGWFVAAGRPLRQARSVDGVNLLQLVLAGEFHDHAAGVALHRLRSGLLEVDVAGQGGGAKQILRSRQQELRLIGAALHFLCHRRTSGVDAACRFPFNLCPRLGP